MAAAVIWFYKTGATLLSGDAEAHLNIARRIIDSRTPGWNQIGTTWLPLPHLIMIPFVRYDELWSTGLAGAIPCSLLSAVSSTASRPVPLLLPSSCSIPIRFTSVPSR